MASPSGWHLRVVGLLCIALATSSVRAEVPPNGVNTLNAAFSNLDALARKTRAEGRPPRLAYPDEAAVLARIWDRSAILGQPPYSAKDIGPLLDILEKQNMVFKTYALFSADPTKLPDTARTAAIFQDEIARSSAMVLRTFAAIVPAMTDFVIRLKPEQITDVRRRGLRQSRVGLIEMVSGCTLMLRSPGLRPDNQTLMVEALAESAPAIATELTRDDRLATSAAAQSTLSSLPDAAKERMRTFITSMSIDVCEGLCAIE